MAFRDLFEWSTRDYSLKEVVEKFQKTLPILTIVSEGYSGRDGMHEFASDEVYWVFEIQKEEKVIAEAAFNRYVSIPIDYPVPFQRIFNGKPTGSALPMSSIIQDGEFQGQKVRFKDDVSIAFNFGADDGSVDQLGDMKLIETYSEKYLLCHSIIKKEIHPLVIGIPAYVPIRMDIASGLCYDTFDKFTKWMKDVSEISIGLENSSIIPRREILIFHESPGGDYEYISPLHFTSHSYDSDDAASENGDISMSSWQLPQVTAITGATPKRKCYTVARNPIKTCIKPVALPSIASPLLHASSPDCLRVSRMQSFEPPILPALRLRTVQTMDRSRCAPAPAPAVMQKTRTLPKDMKSSRDESSVKDAKKNERRHEIEIEKKGKMNNSFAVKPVARNPPPPPPPPHHLDVKSELRSPSNQVIRTGHKVLPLRSNSTDNEMNIHVPSLSLGRGATRCSSRMLETNTTPKNSKAVTVFHRNGRRDSSSQWKSLDDVPADVDISQLTVEEVTHCLELLDLDDYIPSFRRMTVDGRMLLELDKSILVEDFGLSKMDALRLTMFAHRWRPKMN